MKLGSLASCLCAVLALVGCSSVQLATPFSPTPDHADKERLAGVWQSGDGFMHVNFATNGLGRFAIPEWKDDTFKVDRGEFILASGTGGPFFCARLDDENGKPQETWSLGAYKINDDALIIWWADSTPFAEALRTGALKGEVITNNARRIVLSSEPKDILKFLEEHADAGLFDYRNPGVFHKVTK